MATKEQQRKADAKRQGKRTRGWACIVYPDSAPENWVQLLDSKHIPALISPLHNADQNADESEKKPHWHVLIIFASHASEHQATAIFEGLNGTIPQAVHHLDAYARYLVHLDNPEKAQYNKADIISLGGANWYEVAYTQAQADDTILDEVEAFLQHTGVVSYATLCDYARRVRPEWTGTIRRRTTHITGYMRSRVWEAEGHLPVIAPPDTWAELQKTVPGADDLFDLIAMSERENGARTKRGEFKDTGGE